MVLRSTPIARLVRTAAPTRLGSAPTRWAISGSMIPTRIRSDPFRSAAPALGTDTFQRASQALWGTAADGQAWGGDANASSTFSISNNTGLVAKTGGTSYSAVLGPAATDAEVYATDSITSFTSSNFGDVLRWTDGNGWYKAYIDGENLVMQQKVGGLHATLATV